MSYLFDGSVPDYFSLSAGPTGVGDTGDWTISCWVDLDLDGALHNWIALQSGSDYYEIGYNNTGDVVRVRRFDSGQGDESTTTGGSVTAAGGWYHVLFVHTSDSDIDIYVDDSGTNSTTTITPDGMPDEAYIGARAGSTPAYAYIAEVAFWNVALSAASITSLAGGANPLAIEAANLTDYFPLKDDTGNDQGSITLSATGSPTQDASHPTIDAPPAGGSIPQIMYNRQQQE